MRARLRVISLLLLFPLVVSAEEDAAVSGIGLDGARFEVRIDRPGPGGRFPDLSRPGETRIPGGAYLELGAPVLWDGHAVVPAGEYRLSIAVDEDGEVALALVGRGGVQRLPVSRGDLFEPGEGITPGLTRVQRGETERGHLLLRWGALLLLGSFERLPQRTVQAGAWRLRHFDYGEEIILDTELPLGRLERLEGARNPRRLTLLPGVAGEPRLRVEDAELADLRGEKEGLQRELAALKRRVRRASPEDEPALSRQAEALEQRLRTLAERIAGGTSPLASYVLEGKPTSGARSPRIVVRLTDEDGAPLLTLSHPGGAFIFLLREG